MPILWLLPVFRQGRCEFRSCRHPCEGDINMAGFLYMARANWRVHDDMMVNRYYRDPWAMAIPAKSRRRCGPSSRLNEQCCKLGSDGDIGYPHRQERMRGGRTTCPFIFPGRRMKIWLIQGAGMTPFSVDSIVNGQEECPGSLTRTYLQHAPSWWKVQTWYESVFIFWSLKCSKSLMGAGSTSTCIV